MIYRLSPVLAKSLLICSVSLCPVSTATHAAEKPEKPAPCEEQGLALRDEAPYRHDPTGFVFPAGIGSFSYQGIRTYQSEAAGLSVEYKDGRAGLSVFLYRNEYTDIPEGPLSEPVQREFVGAIEALSRIESWQRAEDQEEQNGIAAVQLECGVIEYQHAAFRARSDRNIEYLSYVLVTGARGHIVKIRLSLPVLEDPEATQDAYFEALSVVTSVILRASTAAG